MGDQEVLEGSTAMDANVTSDNCGKLQMSDDIEETEQPGAKLLNDLDLYLEDLEDLLTISRMVSHSVIKGMVTAVELEAAEKIANKELELERLKDTLHLYHVSTNDNESIRYSLMQHKPKSNKYGFYPKYQNALADCVGLLESLGNLKVEAKEQYKKLKREIDKIKGSSTIRRKGSDSELVGLSGILPEKTSDKWIDVDRTLDGLRTTLDSVFKQAEDMVHLSKSSIMEWQLEREFEDEVEGMVIKNCIDSLQQEFEQRLWDQNARSYGNQSTNWLEKVKEISKLRQELDSISKSLSVPESGQLISHGSLEHRKASGNHVSSATSIWEGNGKHDESIIRPENLDPAQLKHMSKDDIVNYFKTEMTKMKRHHESKVQEMTEDYFILKREYFKEMGSSLPVRKDKECDILRKKIPEVLLKLDSILAENEKSASCSDNAESLGNLKDRLESLRSENILLKDLLTEKKKEIKCLSSKVSGTAEKMLEHFLVEAYLLRMIADLKCVMEDAHIEASIGDDIYNFLLKQLISQIKFFGQDSDMACGIMQGIYEVIFREAAQNIQPTSKPEIEDSDLESIIIQGLHEVVLREACKEAEEKLCKLDLKIFYQNEVRLALEMEVLEKEKTLQLNTAEKEKLKQEILSLKETIEEKNKLVEEATDALAREKQKLKSASLELDNLKVRTIQQEKLLLQSTEESQAIKNNLAQALKKIKLDKCEICRLSEALELVTKNLRETAEEKDMLLTVDKEHNKQMDSVTAIVHGLSRTITDFESKAVGSIERNSSRLKNLTAQLRCLIPKAIILRKTGSLYKQKFQRKCSDLQKAETEVDLLGDEVDALLSLLEKIYIALDHYSPILQHYPGIIEILKLVRRELSGESIKPV